MSIKGTTLEFRRLKPPPPFIMLKNLSLKSFASAIGASKVDFVRNPHTGKLFASFDNGSSYKVEQAIDFTKPIEVLMEDGDLDSACVMNTRLSNTVHSISLA